jgi:hypothetical protein
VLAADRFLLLFGAAVGGYVWTVVADAGAHLGGRPVGEDAAGPVLIAAGQEATVHA